MTNSEAKPSSGVRFLDIDAEYAGQRIDNFLQRELKGAPKSLIYRILRKGEVRVNKGRIKPQYRLQAGDQIRIPPVRLSESDVVTPGQGTLARLQAAILHEDEGLLVINKPSGLAVHGGSGLDYGVIEALRALRPDDKGLELVHRLDRETSGCLLIAKKRSVLRQLHEMMREGKIDKRYLALLAGPWHGGEKRIDAPLKKNVLASGERMVKVSPDGKAALSLFSPHTRYKDATLVSVQLITGRTHQVRVHAQHINQPIAGDSKYGDEAFNRLMRERGLKRLFLHAQSLRFIHPLNGEPFEISAPMEPALCKVLDNLELKS